jgi:nucleoid-associated protein YgaU
MEEEKMCRYAKLVLAAGLALFLLACPSTPKAPEVTPAAPAPAPVEKKPAASPVFNPGEGTYTEPVDVVITSATDGAQIRYTLDGSSPSSTSGTLYSGPIHIGATTTITAVASKADFLDSSPAKATYTITGTVAEVIFDPPEGTYQDAQTVTLQSATEGAEIYYTTDGSDPSATQGTLFQGSVEVGSTMTLKAVAVKKGWKDPPIASAVYTITGTAAEVVFDPPEGTYQEAQTVTLQSATEGAEIYYTTDGSDPSAENGTLSEGSVDVASSMTLKAVAVMRDWKDSPVAGAAYAITGTVAEVVFDPPEGTYEEAQTVTLQSATEGAEIYYTTDESDPSAENGTLYEGSVDVAFSMTLKAVAVIRDWKDSPVAGASYLITGTVAEVVFDPPEGTYPEPFAVTLYSDTEGAEIYYTTDGSEPSAQNGTLFEGSIEIDSSTTVKAVAVKQEWNDSPVTNVSYVIKVPVPAVTDEEISGARDAIARAKAANADYYDPSTIAEAENLLNSALAVRDTDPETARQDLASAKEKADTAFQSSVEREALDLGNRMEALKRNLLDQRADKYLPDEYTNAVAGIDETRDLYQRGELADARARGYETLKAMADLFDRLQNRIASIKILKRDTEQFLQDAETVDAATWAPDAKAEANALYLQGLDAFQSYRLDDAEENFGAAREAAKDAVTLAKDNQSATVAEQKKKTEALKLQTMQAIQDAASLTVVTENGTIIKPEKWSGEDMLKQIEKMRQEREQQQKENQSLGGQSMAVPTGPGTVVLADESQEDLLTQAKQLWQLGLQEEANGNYAKAQEYYQEALRYIEVYKSFAVKGVYTVRLIPEARDCLWRISGYDFIYGDPRLWPKIWRRNRKLIQNPDLIYPGWELVIPP